MLARSKKKHSSNPRISKKERGLLKGAVRRVFSRSDLRRAIVENSIKKGYTDPSRPRVKKWSTCSLCHNLVPTYKIEIDHILPVVPIDSELERMTWDELVNNIWCDEKSLQAACESCHLIKTKAENKQRRELKKKRKKDGKSG